MSRYLPWIGAAVFVLVARAAPPAPAGEEKKARRPAPQAVKALKEAAQLLAARQTEKGVEKLRSVVAGFPGDPAAEKAKDLLRENGAGDEIQVTLARSDVFRDKLKITERSVLDLGEKIEEELKGLYKGLKDPYFKKSHLDLHFFDSQARYREKGGSITSAGNFVVSKTNHKLRSVEGTIEWYFPQEAGSVKDRQTFMTGLLYHEMTHYLSTVHFSSTLPQVIDEGLATYFTSRLNTEFYQHYRSTDRQRLESSARNGLSAITRFEDFVALLDAPRALGRGDVTVQRWYGQCYAIVDFLTEEEIGDRKGSLEGLLGTLKKLTVQKLEDMKKEAPKDAKREARPPSRAFMEDLIKEVYDVKLEDFHKLLLKRILAKYKQV